MPIQTYIVLIILLLTGAVIIWCKVLEFYHYDYRKKERTGESNRPGNDYSISTGNSLPDCCKDDYDPVIDEWVYDPETKSFKKK